MVESALAYPTTFNIIIWRFYDDNGKTHDSQQVAPPLPDNIGISQPSGLDRHGVLLGKRIRRLTPRECLRLQGWRDDRIDRVLAIQSDNQVYKQAGNGVTVTVVEAIGRRLAAVHNELEAMDKA